MNGIMNKIDSPLLSILCEILLLIGPRKKYCFAIYLSCSVSLNQALYHCSEFLG